MQKYGAAFFGTFWLFRVAPINGGQPGVMMYRFLYNRQHLYGMKCLPGYPG